jgi:DNA polymerase III subunit epsilon
LNSLLKQKFVVIDVETTGLDYENDRVTEIALIKVENNKVKQEFSSLINPEKFISPYITELTGITNELVFNEPKFIDIIPKIKDYLNSDGIILGGHNVSFDKRFLNEELQRCGEEEIKIKTVCTGKIGRRLNIPIPSKSLSNLARYFRIKLTKRHRALEDAKATAEILIKFIETLSTRYSVQTTDELMKFQNQKINKIFKPAKRILELRKNVKVIPKKSGVYFFTNKHKELIYVGKALSLRDRVSSYFNNLANHDSKTKRLVRDIHNIEYQVTGSELSALILESHLIKKYKPNFNIADRRYRRFPFIRVDIQNAYPKIEKTNEVKPDGAKYYGPFSSSITVNGILEHIEKNYSLRKCRDKYLKPYKKFTPCMYYEIGQCAAPCNFSQSPKDYRKIVNKVIRYIEDSTKDSVINRLEKDMEKLAKEMKFEEAAFTRDKINDLRKVLTNLRVIDSNFTEQNYILKCESNGDKEFFLIVNGKLIKNITANGEDNRDEIMKDINHLYFHGNLFKSVYFNSFSRFKIEEMNTMKIIYNWIYNNNSDNNLLKIDDKTSKKRISEFIS